MQNLLRLQSNTQVIINELLVFLIYKFNADNNDNDKVLFLDIVLRKEP